MDHHPLPPVVPGTATLLIVDDVDVVRRATAGMLSEEGYDRWPETGVLYISAHGAEIMAQGTCAT